MNARSAVAFLTSIGGAAAPEPGMVAWFPVVGAVVGGVVGGVWWAAAHWWPPVIAAAIAVVADLAVTGLLHMDGLVDAADGLLPHLTRQRRLEVMAEPGAGAYGVTVAATVLVLRVVALAALATNALLLAAVWCASRTVMAVAMRTVPYAREPGGLASSMLGGAWLPVGVLGSAVALAGGAVATGWSGVAAVAACLIAAAGVVLLGHRQLGGFTGDVLGAAGVVGETVALIVAAARW